MTEDEYRKMCEVVKKLKPDVLDSEFKMLYEFSNNPESLRRALDLICFAIIAASVNHNQCFKPLEIAQLFDTLARRAMDHNLGEFCKTLEALMGEGESGDAPPTRH